MAPTAEFAKEQVLGFTLIEAALSRGKTTALERVLRIEENFCAGGKRLCFIDEYANQLTWHCRCAP
jgi:hypothetical protein